MDSCSNSESDTVLDFNSSSSIVSVSLIPQEEIPECEPNGITSRNLWQLETRKKLHCNKLNCKFVIHDEGLVLPCGHVFCYTHSPWVAGQSNQSPTGYRCPLCFITIEADSEQYLFSSSLNMRGQELALVGVQPIEMVNWLSQSVKVWLKQSQAQLLQELQAAKAAHLDKRRRIDQCRVETDEIRYSIDELKTYLANKRHEEAQLKRQAETVRNRLQKAETIKDDAKLRLETLKEQLARERLCNAKLAEKLTQADEEFHRLIVLSNRINRQTILCSQDLSSGPEQARDFHRLTKKIGRRHRRRNHHQRVNETIGSLISNNTAGLYEHLRQGAAPDTLPPCFRVTRR